MVTAIYAERWTVFGFLKVKACVIRHCMEFGRTVLNKTDQIGFRNTACFRRNSKYFRRWKYGLFRVSSHKHVSNFQWVWKYSCLNVTHKKPYKRYETKTNDVLMAFIGYVNDLSKLQQFKLSVQKSHHRLQCTFQPSWQHYKNLICTRQLQTAVSSHPLKIGHMLIWTYLLGIVHTTTS